MSVRRVAPWVVLATVLVASLVFVAVRGGDEASVNDRDQIRMRRDRATGGALGRVGVTPARSARSSAAARAV